MHHGIFLDILHSLRRDYCPTAGAGAYGGHEGVTLAIYLSSRIGVDSSRGHGILPGSWENASASSTAVSYPLERKQIDEG